MTLLFFLFLFSQVFGASVLQIDNDHLGGSCLTSAPGYVSDWLFWGIVKRDPEVQRVIQGRACVSKHSPCGNGALVTTLKISYSEETIWYKDIECEELKGSGMFALLKLVLLILFGIPGSVFLVLGVGILFYEYVRRKIGHVYVPVSQEIV